MNESLNSLNQCISDIDERNGLNNKIIKEKVAEHFNGCREVIYRNGYNDGYEQALKDVIAKEWSK